VSPTWRHGVWIAVQGQLEVNGELSAQFVLWADTSPTPLAVQIVSSSDELLRIYNVWDSGRGLGAESQAATSGMLREDVGSGYRYRCNAIAAEPRFDAIEFTIGRRQPG
jgi:hypothetical protein